MLIKRKIFSVLILLCAGFFLVSCKAAFSQNSSSNLKSSSLSELCDETAQKLLSEDQQPVSLTYYCMREASSQYEITDADTIRSVLREAEKDASSGIITPEFCSRYLDKIYVTPEGDSMRLDIKIFTGEACEKSLSRLKRRSGHISKKMIEDYENRLK